MARLRARVEPDKRHHPGLDLLMGPTDAPGEYSAEELGALWPTYRGEIMAGPNGRQRGKRPWAWWVFECGEECPDDPTDEAVRLAELGELTAAEVAALREAAVEAGLRVGTPGEHISGGWRQTPGAVSPATRTPRRRSSPKPKRCSRAASSWVRAMSDGSLREGS